MDQCEAYIADSLEQHLFFARIMKEHAFFLKVGFLPANGDLSKKSEEFLRKFEALLSRVISRANGIVSSSVLDSGEVVTEFTQWAERKTQCLTGTKLDESLTSREIRLAGANGRFPLGASPRLNAQISRLNREALDLVSQLIAFKEGLLRDVKECSVFTANYPLLIAHILREARLYQAHLLRLEGLSSRGCQQLCDSELFWNQIMMEHAQFIRGLLDPTEEALIDTADGFVEDYQALLQSSASANDRVIDSSLVLTEKFRDFKRSGAEGIQSCQIQSLILPLLADHVLREANHYIRLLET